MAAAQIGSILPLIFETLVHSGVAMLVGSATARQCTVLRGSRRQCAEQYSRYNRQSSRILGWRELSVTSSSPKDVTALLCAWSEGDAAALDRLMPLVYAELRRMARRHMARERGGHTIQTTALVHEVYLRLVDQERVRWQDRTHFFAIAAQLMRRILVDHARKRLNSKRGGKLLNLSIEAAEGISVVRAAEVVAIDDALKTLSGVDERKGRIVELRFFGGLSIEETADALGVSAGTVMRDWTLAKAWLKRELSGPQRDGT